MAKEGRQDCNIMEGKQLKITLVKQSLQSELESTIDQRVERYLEIDHQGIIGAHHFAKASSECINLYRDGYFISAVMVSQAVNEGIIKFIAEKNGIKHENFTCSIDEFVNKKIISKECAEATNKIWKSFRNDVHHMNPKVDSIPFQELAKNNLLNLAVIEKEIFGVDVKDGKLAPHQPQYWNIGDDGLVPVFLRLG